MLTFLGISDFALIKSLQLELGPGLTVISGETGAGKSIILAALGLLLGQRAASDLIRGGADSAVVEAQFFLEPGSEAVEALLEEGVSPEGANTEELVVRRVVSAQGRNRVQVNGGLSTLALLGRLVPPMVSICGQHAHQVLLKPEEHLAMLDAFAGAGDLRERMAAGVRELRKLDREIAESQAELDRREQRREELGDTVRELEEAALDPAEEEELKAERRLLANVERIAQLGQGALDAFYSAEEGSALELLGQGRGLLAELSGLDPKTGDLAGRVDEAYYQLEEAARDLENYLSGLSFDPGRLDWVEARLADLQRITRKYGGSVASSLEALERARKDLAGLEQGGQHLANLQAKRSQRLAQVLDLARELSKKRRQAAPRLAKAAEEQLGGLGMAQCRMRVEFEAAAPAAVQSEDGPLGPAGLETAQFHIAPNPGEGFMPLARIASGGELSRILLALESLLARGRGAATLIFDEVDAGIGGVIGSAVGRKLAGLAREGQVICITHLPQIAAWADSHFTVGKQTRDGRTVTELSRLDEEGSRQEIARMLAGAEGQDTAMQHAGQMLAAAQAEKNAAD